MINLAQTAPLVLVVDEDAVATLDSIDAGAAYTQYLHSQAGRFDQVPLENLADVVSKSIDPSAGRYGAQVFEYADLREVDDVYGQILKLRRVTGTTIGSTKHRFEQGDILFAKIMPSLANKKIALVTEPITNAVASTEFLVLRKRPDVNVNIFYLFRALRSDHFTEQAVANVTGATGRQRIDSKRLLNLRVILPPIELQDQIGRVVEEEFTLRAQAAEKATQSDEEAGLILGMTTLRLDRPASRAAARRRRRSVRPR